RDGILLYYPNTPTALTLHRPTASAYGIGLRNGMLSAGFGTSSNGIKFPSPSIPVPTSRSSSRCAKEKWGFKDEEFTITIERKSKKTDHVFETWKPDRNTNPMTPRSCHSSARPRPSPMNGDHDQTGPDPEEFLAAVGEFADAFGWTFQSLTRGEEVVAVVGLDNDPSFEQVLWVYDTDEVFLRCLLVSRAVVEPERV